MSKKQMKTFKDFYGFLQGYTGNFKEWISTPWTHGPEKQESVLRLLGGFGLISKIGDYNVCHGNFNKKTIAKHESYRDIFYKGSKLINLKDKGDASDLTCISKTNDMHMLLTTSKNLKKYKAGGLDIEKIESNFKQYDGYTMSLCICARNLDEIQAMKNRMEGSSHVLKTWLDREDTIVIDWADLEEAYHKFKSEICDNPFKDIINENTAPLIPKMHQTVGRKKTLQLKADGVKLVLWGHIQRSGKSYIMTDCIISDSQCKDTCNYLIITLAPNETSQQQRDVLNCLQLKDFNIVMLNGTTSTKPKLTAKNIILCSKQFLQHKIGTTSTKITKTAKLKTIKKHLRLNSIKVKRTYSKEQVEVFIKTYHITDSEILEDNANTKPRVISWLKKMTFDMRFVDESHNGGTSSLAQKTFDYYGGDAFTVQITATYSKPVNDYCIPPKNHVLWDLEDMKLCKNIDSAGSMDRLVEKHGEDIRTVMAQYSQANIIAEYKKYPNLHILTDEITPESVTILLEETMYNDNGWSTEANFLLKQGEDMKYMEEFQKESETLKMWYKMFGKKSKLGGAPDKEYPDDKVFLKRIENICNRTGSRFMGEGVLSGEPTIIMAFLPVFTDRGEKYLSKLSNATIKLLEKYKVIPEFDIISINGHCNGKLAIEDARVKARNSGKKGVLVLSGKKCSLGVSIDNCDIILLLNNNNSYDMIYQMMFRCMTGGKGKKCGFVVDLNIHRVIETSVINYASQLKPGQHPREGIKYLLQERLININADHWMPTFGHYRDTKLDALCTSIYDLHSSNIVAALHNCLSRLRFREVLLDDGVQKIFNTIFSSVKPTTRQKEIIDSLLEDTEQIKKGIEKIKVDNGGELSVEEKEEKNVNYMDILKHIIPLICMLTIHSRDTTSLEPMVKYMEDDKHIYNILIDQTKSWWGKNVDKRIIKLFIEVYVKYLKDDPEIDQIIRTVKELFVKNIRNSRELSKLIDTYLIPQELEKKSNAEVSTPFKLRQEMMDKMHLVFWTTKKKVFEPCSGKGGFILDIVDRFTTGLTEAIPDEMARYKTIVEECLYFCDINPTNIFICKLLLDPYNDYTLNFHEGNTLELDIHEKWGIDGFDAVIGNPPYNSSGNTGTGNTIWQHFTKKSLDTWVRPGGLLMFVHPPGWRKPNTTRGKFYGMYELMTKDNQMEWLSIHGIKDGKKTFNCGTRYDWYLIEKTPAYKHTVVNDEQGIVLNVGMSEFNWLPNYNIKAVRELLADAGEETCEIIQSMSAYEPRKKWMNKTKDELFKYPCIHSTPKKGVRYMYSKFNDRGHFDIPKVIFGDSGINNPIIDITGKYGMTQHSMGIKIYSLEEGELLAQILKSDRMNDLINSCLYSSYAIDWNIFKDMKRDFWNEI